MPSNHLILCHPLLLLPLTFLSFPASRSFPTSQLFASGEGDQGRRSHTYIRFTFSSLDYPCFSFSISPSSEYSGLISFRIDRFDLLAVQGTCFRRVFSSTTVQRHQFFLAQTFFFYCPALTSVHDYWKNHSFAYMELCRQNNVSAF